MPQRRRRKHLGVPTAEPQVTADAPNLIWAVDFQFDATTDGRPIKIVSIMDEHTRECPGGLGEQAITADRLVDELDRIALDRGRPTVLRSANGPELACATMRDWGWTAMSGGHGRADAGGVDDLLEAHDLSVAHDEAVRPELPVALLTAL